MKKIILSVSLSLLTIAVSFAQPLLTEFGAFDDFSTTDEYLETSGRRIHWVGKSGYTTLTRNSANNELIVKAKQPVHSYEGFSVNFGNGRTIDLSENGTWSFDITNYGTEDIILRVSCQDIEDTLIDCFPIPNTEGKEFDDLGVWAYQIQILIPAGKTVTYKAGTPNSAGGEKFNNCDFTKGVWGDWGTWDDATQKHLNAGIYDRCDRTKIKSINFVPLNAAKDPDIFHALELVDGHFGISNFRVGSVSEATGLGDEIQASDYSAFPNPVKGVLIIQNQSHESIKSVEITNSVGRVVYFHEKFDVDQIAVDTEGFNPGVYLLKVNNKIEKIIIE